MKIEQVAEPPLVPDFRRLSLGMNTLDEALNDDRKESFTHELLLIQAAPDPLVTTTAPKPDSRRLSKSLETIVKSELEQLRTNHTDQDMWQTLEKLRNGQSEDEAVTKAHFHHERRLFMTLAKMYLNLEDVHEHMILLNTNLREEMHLEMRQRNKLEREASAKERNLNECFEQLAAFMPNHWPIPAVEGAHFAPGGLGSIHSLAASEGSASQVAPPQETARNNEVDAAKLHQYEQFIRDAALRQDKLLHYMNQPFRSTSRLLLHSQDTSFSTMRGDSTSHAPTPNVAHMVSEASLLSMTPLETINIATESIMPDALLPVEPKTPIEDQAEAAEMEDQVNNDVQSHPSNSIKKVERSATSRFIEKKNELLKSIRSFKNHSKLSHKNAPPPVPVTSPVAEAPEERTVITNVHTEDTTTLVADVMQRARTGTIGHCIPHRFQAHAVFAAARCQQCNHMIWSGGASVKCTYCRAVVHAACSEKMPPTCGMKDVEKLMAAAVAAKTGKAVEKDQKTGLGDIFGMPLTQLAELESVEIPLLVTSCVQIIEERALKEQGLYRLSGKKSDIDRLKVHFSYGRPNLEIEAKMDVNTIAGALKLFLRELPEPLITFQCYSQLIKAINENPQIETQHRIIKEILQTTLPPVHYRVLAYLCRHLKKVAQNAEFNKMASSNLAVVFGPTIMRPPTAADMVQMSYQCAVVEALIQKVDFFFGKSE